MGIKLLLLGVFATITALLVAKYWLQSYPMPVMKDGWFGRGPVASKNESIRSFKVDIPQNVLDDLLDRLDNVCLGEDLENVQFQYRFKVSYMHEILEYWKTKYNWKKHEEEINRYPQYITNIEGIDVHFIHAKPSKPTDRVLLLLHGWPGSVWEFYKILPMLTDPASHGGREEDAMEVVCPSIPGYGFSEAPHQPGFSAVAGARVLRKLMSRLRYHKFYVQGGDLGVMISTIMAQAYPDCVLGIHINMLMPSGGDPVVVLMQIVANYFPSLVGVTPKEYANYYPLSRRLSWLLKETGYLHIQATRPDTIAFGLNDSPVGLAAYILEKFSGWTNPDYINRVDGGLTEKFTLDELLTNVMVYWVTGTIGSSMRFYKECFDPELHEWDSLPVKIPTGISEFPGDQYNAFRCLVERKYRNIVTFSTQPRGGHFAALEEPRLLADDIFTFIRVIEQM